MIIMVGTTMIAPKMIPTTVDLRIAVSIPTIIGVEMIMIDLMMFLRDGYDGGTDDEFTPTNGRVP